MSSTATVGPESQGTPTTLIIDAQGQRRRQLFGVHEDSALGAGFGRLLMEAEQRGHVPATQK